MKRRHLALATTPLVAAALVAGCGSSGDKADVAASSASRVAAEAAAKSAGSAITIKTTEFAFSPMAAKAKAGAVKLTLVNAGKVEHEVVVLKTDQAAGALKVSGGRVSEADSVGEVSETAPGATKSATLRLKPGRYVVVCNIPGHYQGGMRGTLTVQ